MKKIDYIEFYPETGAMVIHYLEQSKTERTFGANAEMPFMEKVPVYYRRKKSNE